MIAVGKDKLKECQIALIVMWFETRNPKLMEAAIRVEKTLQILQEASQWKN